MTNTTPPTNRKKFVLLLCGAFAVALLAASFLYRLDNPSLQERSRVAQHGGEPGRAGAMPPQGMGGKPPEGMDQQRMEMIQGFMQELSKNPNDPEVLRNTGKAFMRMGALDQAAALFTKALVADPADTSSMYLLGITHFEKGEHKEAAQYFETIHSMDPANAEATFNLAMIYKHYLKRPDDARGLLKELQAMEGLSEDLRTHVRQEFDKKD